MVKMTNIVASFVLIITMTFACQILQPRGPAGDYLAKASTTQGVVDFTMSFNTDGTGYVESMMGKSEFSDVEIEGDKFRFYTTMNSQMGEMQLTFIGAVDGENISGTVSTQMGDIPFTGQKKQID
jgi:hypothetical protein